MSTSSPEEEIFKIHFADKSSLYLAYMSYVKQGGLFIVTNKIIKMGEMVKLIISFVDKPGTFPVTGKVIWVTPVGAQGNKMAGIGVQFQGEEGGVVRNEIEGLLAGALKSERPTNTM